jgi:PAS domain S-box-containing protein
MRILIADDHELARRGVRSVLERRPDLEICGEAADGRDAIERCQELRPDLVLMDINMPRVNGLEAIREMRQLVPEVNIIVVTQHDATEIMRQALRAGAKGYVLKRSISEKLIAAIDSLSAGSPGFQSESLRAEDTNLDTKEILRRAEAFERALRESEERFRLTFEQAAVGIAHIAPDGTWLRVNRKLCDIVGYTPEELSKLTFQSITCPADLEADLAQVQKLVAGEIDHYAMEKRYVRKNGSVVWANLTVSAVREAQGKVKYFVSVVEEIAARKKAEEWLRERDEQLRALTEYQSAVLNTLAEGVCTLDEDGRVTSMNSAAEAMLGWTCAEIMGRRMHDVTHHKRPDGSPVPASECQELHALQHGVPLREYEDIFIAKDGSFVPVVFSASPLRRNGRSSGVVVEFRDDREQRRARGASRESELRLRKIIDALPTAIYTTDAEGVLTHFNRAAVEFAGRVPELGVDRWCVSWKLFRPDGSPLPHEECPMAITLKGAQSVSGQELIAERPDGTRRWFTPHPQVLRDDQGNIVGGLNMLLDVTEQRQGEQANTLLAAIVDFSDDAIVSKNLDGVITSWNKGAERLFGYTAEEAVGQSIKLIIPPERHQEEADILARLRRGERVDHFETVRLRKDGTPLDISLTISPIKTADGRIIGASKVARDITDRKRAELALAEAARQQSALFRLAEGLHRAESLEDIYSLAMDAVLAALPCDRSSILLYDESGSMGFVSWRGISEEYRNAVAGHSMWKPDDPNPEPICVSDVQTAAYLPGLLREAIQSEGIRAAGFFPLLSNRRLIGEFMTCYNAPHRFGDREGGVSVIIAGALAYGIERKRGEQSLRESEERFRALAQSLEEQVRARTEELELRNAEVTKQSEQLGDLSARLLQAQDDERRRIARELHDSAGQILTGLGLNLATIAKYAPEDALHVVGAIEHSQELVAELTQEIRTMSYLLHPPLLEESGLAEAIRCYVQGLKERSTLDISLEISPELERLSPAAELVIFRVVQEALTNVHRHSHSRTALIRLVQKAKRVFVEIRDQGSGIPAGKLREIQLRGAGVGLRGMRERVRQFKGELKIESGAAGTTVSVLFPLSEVRSKQKARTPAVRETAPPESAGKKRVLIADDSALVRRAVCDLISREPCWEVCGEAATGAEAVEGARELQPDLVLVDINLPDMSGIQVVRMIRKEMATVAILVMSHHDPRMFLAGAVEAGADGCLDKGKIAGELSLNLKSIEAKRHFVASTGGQEQTLKR